MKWGTGQAISWKDEAPPTLLVWALSCPGPGFLIRRWYFLHASRNQGSITVCSPVEKYKTYLPKK